MAEDTSISETSINLTEGSGKRTQGWDRTVSSVLVQQPFVLPGEFPYPTYSVTVTAISAATSGDHIVQIMAGSSKHVRIRRITAYHGAPTGNTQVVAQFSLIRLTTAGTGGTSVTPLAHDTGSAASGATAMTLPSSKGTEAANPIRRFRMITLNAVTATGTSAVPMFEWAQLPNEQPIIIAAGTSNGIALKPGGSYTGLTLDVNIEFVETDYL